MREKVGGALGDAKRTGCQSDSPPRRREDAVQRARVRRERIRAGEAHEPRDPFRLGSSLREELAVQREVRGGVGSGRVTHQHDAARIAAELLCVRLHPRDGMRGIVQEIRKLHFRIQAIVGQHSDEPALRQRRADEAIVLLGAAAATSRRTRRRRPAGSVERRLRQRAFGT